MWIGTGSEVSTMMVLITYDVNVTTDSGKTRLRRVAKQCVNSGQRVQNSVFECLVDPAQFAELKHRLESIIDSKTDSLRYYFLGNNWKTRVEHVGAKSGYDPEGVLMV
jgi:CRISPR-associated protein Cas2